MAQVTLNSLRDARINNQDPTGNYGNAGEIYIGNSNGAGDQTYRSLIHFDLSTIPAGSTITAAVLRITVLDDLSDNARTISAYRVLRAWTEAGVTWNKFDGTSDWGTAGCANTTTDREAANIGTAAQPASPSINDVISITLTASKVQEWFTGVLANNGVLLQVDTEANDAIGYDSSEGTDVPTLLVTYTPPATQVKNYAYFM